MHTLSINISTWTRHNNTWTRKDYIFITENNKNFCEGRGIVTIPVKRSRSHLSIHFLLLSLDKMSGRNRQILTKYAETWNLKGVSVDTTSRSQWCLLVLAECTFTLHKQILLRSIIYNYFMVSMFGWPDPNTWECFLSQEKRAKSLAFGSGFACFS